MSSSTTPTTGTTRVKRGMADMLKGGVIMDVVTPEQAKIAEDAGAVAVMALERVPADIRAAFSAQKRDLLVEIRPDAPLPHRWLINQLPLTARFSCGWLLNWLW